LINDHILIIEIRELARPVLISNSISSSVSAHSLYDLAPSSRSYHARAALIKPALAVFRC